jgi:hypothetical protein
MISDSDRVRRRRRGSRVPRMVSTLATLAAVVTASTSVGRLRVVTANTNLDQSSGRCSRDPEMLGRTAAVLLQLLRLRLS